MQKSNIKGISKSDISKRRRESYLQEVLSMAIASLSDTRLNSLNVVGVVSPKGKSDIKVLIESSYLSKEEIKQASKLLAGARGALQDYILGITNWYCAPKITFEFDNTLSVQNRLDDIFKQIKTC